MITSFRTEHFEVGFDFDIELEANKQIYCFIGKNGVGKTQLLENMAKSLIFSHSMFENPIDKQQYIRFTNNIIFNRLKNVPLKLPVITEVNKIKIKDISQRWGFINLEDIKVNRNNAFICEKPVIFIGAKNRGFTKNIDINNVKILSDSQSRFADSFQRTLKYLNNEGLEHEEIADWFASRLIINPYFVKLDQNKAHEAQTVLKLIERLEPSINLISKNEQGITILNVMFSEGKLLINNIPLDNLSTGYVSIIKIFQEIVAGYSGWTNTENLNEVEGIVFIDEIEPHLHISWQTKIIKILREFFPKTTFFISTHSPLVLAGLKNGEGYELIKENNIVKAKPIDNIESYFLNDIIKEFFDVDLNKEKIQNVNQERQQKGKKILLNLLQNLQEDK